MTIRIFFLVSNNEIYWSQKFSASTIVGILPELISPVDILSEKVIALVKYLI